MKYTIEQINEAWIAFNKPLMLIDGKNTIELDDHQKIDWSHSFQSNIEQIYRTDFISFLLEFFRKKNNQTRSIKR